MHKLNAFLTDKQYKTTVEDVYEIYLNAWKAGLKGLTIFRDGCKRSGILINEKTSKEKKSDNKSINIDKKENTIYKEVNEKFVCPECGNEQVANTGGCSICLKCGYSKCN